VVASDLLGIITNMLSPLDNCQARQCAASAEKNQPTAKIVKPAGVPKIMDVVIGREAVTELLLTGVDQDDQRAEEVVGPQALNTGLTKTPKKMPGFYNNQTLG
jgi:hypothetical protein